MNTSERTSQSFLDDIKAMGGGSYQDVRQLDDGTIVGIGRLLYTTAIYMDLSLWGWGQRFCYDKAELAVAEYRKLQTGNDEPEGWIARRPLDPCN